VQTLRECSVRERVGVSRRGRRPHWQRDFDLGAHSNLRDYLFLDGEPPVYGEYDFEDRFSMPRCEFNRLFRVIYYQQYLRRSINATGHRQAHVILKVAAALRVLGHGELFERSDKY